MTSALKRWSGKVEMISVKVDRPNQVLYFSSLSALGR